MQNGFKFNKKIISILIALIIIFGVFFSFFKYLEFKLSDVNFLKQKLEEKTELVLLTEKVQSKFSLFSFSVYSPYLAIKNKQSDPFIELTNAKFKLSLFPLFVKKIQLAEVVADDIYLSANILDDGTIDVLNFFKKSEKKIFKLDLSKTLVNLDSYSINVNDKSIKNKLLIIGHGINALGLDIKKKFKISTNGLIVINRNGKIDKSPYLIDFDLQKKGKKFVLNKKDIVFSSLKLSFLQPYLSKYNFSKFDVKFDIFSSSLDKGFRLYTYFDKLDLAFTHKDELNTIVSSKPLINFLDFTFINSDLVIKNGNILSDGIDINYIAKVKNLAKLKNVHFDLGLKITDTDVDKISKLVPDTVLPLQNPYFQNIKIDKLNGIIDGYLVINFKDRLKYNVFGKLNFNDVFVQNRPKNAKTAFGSCEFFGREVFIDVFANAPNDVVLTVFGKTQMNKKPFAEFKIDSFGKLDMQFAHGILMPVQRILSLKLGPLPYMTLKGNGEIDLHTKGTRDNANLSGWFFTDDATVTMDGLNAILTNGNVKVNFDGSVIDFSGAKGLINGAETFINGNAQTNGDLLIDVSVKDISAKYAMTVAQTSDIVKNALDGGEFLKSFIPTGGKVDFDLNLSGNVPPNAEYGAPNDSILAKGKLNFKNVDLIIEPKIKGSKVNGVLTFDNKCEFDLKGNIFNSPFKILGEVSQKGDITKFVKGQPSNLKLQFISDKVSSTSVGNFILDNLILFTPQNRLFAKNLAQIFLTNKFDIKGNVTAQGLVYPNSTELDLSNFDFLGEVYGINDKNSDFSFKSGNISLKNKDVKFNNLNIMASGVDLVLDGVINKFVSEKPFNNLKIIFNESKFDSYVSLFMKILPTKAKNSFKNFSNYNGVISGKIKLFADKIDGEFIPKNLSLFDNKTQSNIVLNSGKIKLKNTKTELKALNFLYDSLPFYVDGFIQSDGSINPDFNIYFTTNLSENSTDKLLNPYLQYPLLLNGEALVKGRIQGNLDSYLTYLTLVLDKGSDLSFMGFKFADIDKKREVASKIKFNKNYADIKYIRYFNYVDSQNNKQTPYDLVNISGGVQLDKNNISLKNLKVYTPNPAPVRFLNLLFKKSLVKDGLFQSNIVLNGSFPNILAKGELAFSKVQVPIFESIVDDIKIKLNDTVGTAQFKLSSFNTIGDFTVVFLNKLTLPVVIENVSVHSDVVLIDNLLKAFASLADSASKATGDVILSGQNNQIVIKPTDVLIKKGSLNVDKLIFNGVEGQNLKLNFSHSKDTVLKIDDAYLAIANGLIKSNGTYKFDTKDVSVQSDFINCDADLLTKAFLNLSGQIYGNANGKFTFAMKDFTPNDYVQKINADAEFEILNGKMPKLGSIEYLLRASNFFKSGILGFTLNNAIQLLRPYKHGEFNKISGNFKISDASIKDLKIYSQGQNLSTYTYGSYDILNGVAKIEVLGKLSKKVSSLLGPIGNASIISVLNSVTRNKMDDLMKTETMQNIGKIPFIDLSNDDFRLFSVKLNGLINKEDIVKSFTWLN